MFMDLREGKTWCGFYSNRLYIAMVSALPPRTLPSGQHSYPQPRDAELVFDPNAVEIWLDPNRDRRESLQGDQAFYQLFVNTLGSLYDARLEPGKGVDKGFNMDIQSAHAIDNERKLWTTEISISLKDLGWAPGTEIGRSIGVLISRNFKAPWNQATWFPHGAPFVSWQNYPRLYLTEDQPVVGIESLGEKFWEAMPEFKVRITNPGPARRAKVNMHIRSSDMPDLKDSKEIELPANGVADYAYKPGEGTLHQAADHYFKLRVEAGDGSRAYFDYVGMWSRDPLIPTEGGWATARRAKVCPFEQKWDIRAEASPQSSVGVSVHPSFNRLTVSLDAGQLVADPDGKDKDKLSDKAVITVTRGDKEAARAEVTFDVAKHQFTAYKTLTLPEMPAGDYKVAVTFNKHPEPIVNTYKRIVFPWEGQHSGVTNAIYPPFTAVKATTKSTEVVCREYGVGELGLWKSIKSLGKEILAGPIVLRARSQESGDRSQKEEGGRPLPPNSDATARVPPTEDILVGKAKLVSSTPQAAVYEAEAKHPAVTVKSRCTTEIDGCMKVELTLLPPEDRSQKSGARSQNGTLNTEHRTLNALVLDIPLKDEMAPLWHACTTALRVNPMGETPAGQGVVWDSRKFPNGDWIGNFTPYIWLGGMERGLCVFGNNDRGWALNWNDKKEFSPCQELIRTNGILTLRLNLVQKPIDLAAEAAASNAAPRTIVLGFMASPGKPIPYKEWRSILGWYGNTLGKGFEHLVSHNFDMPTAKEEVFCAAYPYGGDYSIYDAARTIPGTAGGDLVRSKGWDAFIADWKKRNGLDKPTDQLTYHQKHALGSIKYPRGLSGYYAEYWDEYHGDSPQHPEVRVFGGEWGANNMAASRRDFRTWHAIEAVKRGYGLYFDNAVPHLTKDPLTSDAYLIAGLGIQGSANLWEMRDYHRRIWNIHRVHGAKWGNKPMSMIHMTNTDIIPYLTWNDMNVDLEWFYGPEPQQSKYGIPLLQAETASLQSGCIPYALAVIEKCKTPEEQRMAERSKFGAMMVHEIRVKMEEEQIKKLARILYGFGYGLSGLNTTNTVLDTVYNYWGDDCPFTCDQPLVKALLVKRGAELMMLVCSWDKAPCTATFTLDTKALGLKLAAAVDAEGTLEEQLAANKAATPAMLEAIKATASPPVAFDAKTCKLTVGLEGYGVRMIRVK
jgi:hypothetical protein